MDGAASAVSGQPAGFMALAGAALLVFAPGGSRSKCSDGCAAASFALLLRRSFASKGLQSRARCWVVYPLLAVYALCAFGGAIKPYESCSIAEQIARRVSWSTSAATGFTCTALDRALRPSSSSQALARVPRIGDGSRLLSHAKPKCAAMIARVEAGAILLLPRKMVSLLPPTSTPCSIARTSRGHLCSWPIRRAQQYIRIFAGRYPEQVAGMVLLDGQPAEAFESLPSFPAFYSGFRRISALFPSLARLGVGRLVYHADFASLPAHARDMQRLNYSSARFYRSLRDEFAELPTSLDQARSFQNLGDRPLVVVTAARDALAGWLPLQDEMATLSTNSSHRVVPVHT